MRNPAVAAVAVVGIPDELRGQIVKAFVVPRADADESLAQELRKMVRERLAAYEYPREIEFVAELPLTVTGKVRRRDLVERQAELQRRGQVAAHLHEDRRADGGRLRVGDAEAPRRGGADDVAHRHQLAIAIDDEAQGYEVSNAYGLTNVPTAFYIAPGGEIEVSSVGWSRDEVDEISAKLAAFREQKPPVLWRAGEDVPAFRAG